MRERAVAREIILGSAQLDLVAMAHELRGLVSGVRDGRCERRPQRLDPGEAHLAVHGPVVLEPQIQQERTERQSLQHERTEGNAERRR